MGQKVVAGMTMSLDGYITGPGDRPGAGLGEGGERLHYWVFGGPWSYQTPPAGSAVGADKDYLEETFSTVGAWLVGQYLDSGVVDELTVTIAPALLGGGKRLFGPLRSDLTFEQAGVIESHHSPRTCDTG